MNSSKREKTPWRNFLRNMGRRKRRTADICLMKAGGRNLKTKPTRAAMFFHSVDWIFGSLKVGISSLSLICPFSSSVFPEALLIVFPRIQWAIFVAVALGVRSSCFIGQRSVPVDSRFDEV